MNQNGGKERVGIYRRAPSGAREASPDEQRLALREHAARRGLEMVEEAENRPGRGPADDAREEGR